MKRLTPFFLSIVLGAVVFLILTMFGPGKSGFFNVGKSTTDESRDRAGNRWEVNETSPGVISAGQPREVKGESITADSQEAAPNVSKSTTLQGEGTVEVDPRDPILSTVSGETSSVRAMPASVPGDGVSEITVIVTARTEEGKLVAGAPVNLESSRGVQDEVNVVKGRTGFDGQAIFLIRSKEPGTSLFNAHVGTRVIDEKAMVRYTDPPTLRLALPPQITVAALAIIAFIMVMQYMFVRSVLDARRFEEEELFFHHPPVKEVK